MRDDKLFFTLNSPATNENEGNPSGFSTYFGDVRGSDKVSLIYIL